MKNQTLKEFCQDKTQAEVASVIGRTQGAISQMLKAGREIYVVTDDVGKVTWYEIRKPHDNAAA